MYTAHRESTIENALLRLRRPNDGKFDDVLTERERIKADLVVLFTKGQRDEAEQGLAYQFRHLPDQDSRGISVVRVSRLGIKCVLAHEIGHNLGAGHDAATVASNEETLTAPYAQGHKFWDERGNVLGDVMAYRSTSVPYYSTPRFKYNGHALGDPETADNARIIREIAPLVAAYR